MSKSRIIHCFLVFTLLFITIGSLCSQAVLAVPESESGALMLTAYQEETPPGGGEVTLTTKFPVVTGNSGDTFEFAVDITYKGTDRRQFDLTTTVPSQWQAFPISSYPEKQIAVVVIDPLASPSYGVEKITVRLSPMSGHLPEPGDYVVTLEVSSGDIKASIDLTARVLVQYGLELITQTGMLNTDATAGRDNHLSVLVINSGSATLENITLSSTKPEGWSITYNPEKIESLEPGLTQEVDVVITPPGKTIAGDWAVTIRAQSPEVSSSTLNLRVTVLTPTIWGWVGVIIVVAVIAGVGILFWRLGRR